MEGIEESWTSIKGETVNLSELQLSLVSQRRSVVVPRRSLFEVLDNPASVTLHQSVQLVS